MKENDGQSLPNNFTVEWMKLGHGLKNNQHQLYKLFEQLHHLSNIQTQTQTRSHNIYMTQFNVYIPGTTMFAHSSCTSLFILLFIKSTVYCLAHFISLHILPLIFVLFLFYSYLYLYICCVVFFFLHCPLSGPVLIYISLLIIFCIFEYVTK